MQNSILVNLLPWREQKKERAKQRELCLMRATFLFVLFFLWIAHYYMQSLIRQQEQRNSILQEKIKMYDRRMLTIKKIVAQKHDLIERMRDIQNLQALRIISIHVLDEIVKILPEGVYLTQMRRDGNKVTLQGVSESSARVSELMRHIKHNDWMHHPLLAEIKASSNTEDTDKRFTLSFWQREV
ncbi:MAG: PilN domain-containing protein [Legionellaceae bacterium]|nr:PilN domain-containing protein [Legionellaceae bacterium]